MAGVNVSDHLAVLIDADNISSQCIAGLMTEVANYGTASVRRVYGDWTSPQMKGWRESLLEHSIAPIQQFAYTTGKNATDGAMIIDAMDLLYTGRFSGFCLVSSDSDFTRLAARIREQGIAVYGFGNRHNTHRAFIAACNSFVYLDAMSMQEDEGDGPTSLRPPVPQLASSGSLVAETDLQPNLQIRLPPPIPRAPGARQAIGTALLPREGRFEPTPRPLDRAALDGLKLAITSSNIYEGDFVNLAEVGYYLKKVSPDLNAKNYGFQRLQEFVVASGIVEVRMKSRGEAPPIALVRLKQ